MHDETLAQLRGDDFQRDGNGEAEIDDEPHLMPVEHIVRNNVEIVADAARARDSADSD